LIVNPDGSTPLQINVGSATSVQQSSVATKSSSDR
jgi:hypothetical protein